ncbi:MAG: DUF4959 domain-containing protein [Tannerella sp.]|jgi:hypothetical protein|nr:DUF4959 domain-containing protein [Tannerella sp.]
MNNQKIILIIVTLAAVLLSCEESKRFEINSFDKTPPGKPILHSEYKKLYGGARIYFTPPDDEDVLTIDAGYLNQKGETVWFSVSYYVDSISIYGMPDTISRAISVYAVDRAGNKSEAQTVDVIPYEPAVSRVTTTARVVGGFGSFYADWKNELAQNINVYVNYDYNVDGKKVEKRVIFTSSDTTARKFIRMEEIPETEPVHVSIMVEDRYGNIVSKDLGQIYLIKDEIIPKDKWTIPNTNDSIGGVPAAFLGGYEGHPRLLYDGVVNTGYDFNYAQTEGRGRTGKRTDGSMPWNLMINLGEEWEISRIITHQRYSPGQANVNTGRGEYYSGYNVGIYKMHIWNADTIGWDSIRTYKIPVPLVNTGQQFKVLGFAGDMTYLYPDDPHFSAPTRWFRYEAMKNFAGDYTDMGNSVLSEITLYGRRRK